MPEALTPALTPVEVMAKAIWESYSGHKGYPWEEYRQDDPRGANLTLEKMRAALRALAEMEPTNLMVAEAKEAFAADWQGSGIGAWRAANLAAASEGETP